MPFSRTVAIVSGLPERNGSIGTHDTRSKLASHCGKTFQSCISYSHFIMFSFYHHLIISFHHRIHISQSHFIMHEQFI